MARAGKLRLDYSRCGCVRHAYGKTLLGDNQTGKFYEPSLEVWRKWRAMPVTIELPPLGDGVNRQTLYSFEVFMETGVGDLTTTDPQAIFTYSKDGGRNWSNEMWRPMGAQGVYSARAVWRVNIEFRQLQLRIVFPDSIRRCALSYHADVTRAFRHPREPLVDDQRPHKSGPGIGSSPSSSATFPGSETVPGSGLTLDGGELGIADDGVGNDKLRNSLALSVMGRPLNSGDPQDMVATGNGRFLQRDNDLLTFRYPKLPSFTVATVPSAVDEGAGTVIYVSNEAGGATVAFSDGTNWLRAQDRAVIS
jgi:hypothetical protein